MTSSAIKNLKSHSFNKISTEIVLVSEILKNRFNWFRVGWFVGFYFNQNRPWSLLVLINRNKQQLSS